jgi:hypothetical protein
MERHLIRGTQLKQVTLSRQFDSHTQLARCCPVLANNKLRTRSIYTSKPGWSSQAQCCGPHTPALVISYKFCVRVVLVVFVCKNVMKKGKRYFLMVSLMSLSLIFLKGVFFAPLSLSSIKRGGHIPFPHSPTPHVSQADGSIPPPHAAMAKEKGAWPTTQPLLPALSSLCSCCVLHTYQLDRSFSFFAWFSLVCDGAN